MGRVIGLIRNIAKYFTGWRYVIKCWSLHFLLGFCVGSLVYWLTLTILSHTSLSTVGVFSTHTFSLLVSLCFVVLSHILEDYYVGKF